MTSIDDIIELPEQVHRGDFVLRLSEGVERPTETLRQYLVTPQLAASRARVPAARSVPELAQVSRPRPCGSRGRARAWIAAARLPVEDAGARAVSVSLPRWSR